MKSTKKIKAIALLFISMIPGGESFSQDIDTTSKNGFYINNGKTRIDGLNCFNFDNLVFTHEITDEMLDFDILSYGVYMTNAEKNRVEVVMMKGKIDGRIFRMKVKGKETVSILIANSNLETSNRKSIAFTTDESNVENMVLDVTIAGGVITGTEEKYNTYTNSYIKEHTYTYTTIPIPNDRIKVENRKKTMDPTHPFARKKDRIIDNSEPCFGPTEGVVDKFEIYFLEDLKIK